MKKHKPVIRPVDIRRPAGIDFNVSVRLSLNELSAMSPEQCTAFLVGIGEVIAASDEPIGIQELPKVSVK